MIIDRRAMRGWWHKDDGATSIEYALIAGIIAVSIIGVLQVLGADTVFGLYNKVVVGMTGAGM